MESLRRAAEAHRKLKERIHGFRMPLSRNGQRVAMVGYMAMPLVGGYFVMDWATSIAEDKWKTVTLPDGTRKVVMPEAVRRRMGGDEPAAEGSAAAVEFIREHRDEHPGRLA